MTSSNKASCGVENLCGGCPLRHLSKAEYQRTKAEKINAILKGIKLENLPLSQPLFIGDGTRRRATFAFNFSKGQMVLGFNAYHSNELVDCGNCLLLRPEIRQALPKLKNLLADLCAEPFISKQGKKTVSVKLTKGDLVITLADNGLDVVIELPQMPELNHRMIISEHLSSLPDVIRVSWRRRVDDKPEVIVEKLAPQIKIGSVAVYIPAGTFLQPSQPGEQALISQVLEYLGEDRGKIADLFCGVGTFSYPLSELKGNSITSIDSSADLLEGFQRSVNRNMISNITIKAKNLFKYPLDEQELKDFDIVVFDPPRAGAKAQVEKLANMGKMGPHKIIAVSCNPETFVRDANILLSGGWHLQNLRMVDQFIYSDHSEIVALFTK